MGARAKAGEGGREGERDLITKYCPYRGRERTGTEALHVVHDGGGGGGGGGDFPGEDAAGGGEEGGDVDDLGGDDAGGEEGGADLGGETIDFEEPGEEPEA